jgi:steroid delta-isomerase-like uncharacterized protein
MSIEEENKAIIQRWIEGMNGNDDSVIDKLLSNDWVYHGPMGELKGPQGFKQMNMAMKPAFPDMQYLFDDMITEGDKVAFRFTLTGTHKGNLMGIAPTHKRIKLTEDYFSRLEDGKIVEHKNLADSAALFQQLGIPFPNQ